MKKWLNKGLIFCLILCRIVSYAQDYSNLKCDEFINDFLDSLTVSKDEKQFEKSLDTKYVRIIYLVPSDSVVKTEYKLCLENAAKHLQYWYYDSLGSGKTFALRDPVVEVYQTSHNSIWYSTNPGGGDFFWNNVLQDGFLLTGGMFNDPNNRWVFYIDADNACDQCGGCGGGGVAVIAANDLRGLTGYELNRTCPNIVHSYPPCRYVGGLGHELGHALGLPHPPTCPAENPHCWDHDLMMYGYTTYPNAFFNEADKTRLNNSPFIQDIDLEGLYFPNACNELTDTCNYSTVTEVSIPFGDSIFLEGAYQKIPGVYHDTLHAVEDCDTIVISNLSIDELLPPVAEDVTICGGEGVFSLTATGENIRWYVDIDNSLPDSLINPIHDLRDNQNYNIVQINGQFWFAENLNYYTQSGSWYYDDDSLQYSENFGRLYNYETAIESCPAGWRLPDIQDWHSMVDHLGGASIAGGKLKETGTEFWQEPNTGATNTSGFTARPGGKYWEGDGSFSMGTHCWFWSSSEQSPSMANNVYLINYLEEILTQGAHNKGAGLSVRCMAHRILIAEGNTYQISVLDPGKYYFYVTQTINTIESEPDTLLLTIFPNPPVGKDITVCEGETVPILTAIGENIKWYSDSDNPVFDSRDGQTYKTVSIGDQVWMAENLNFYTFQGSWYYNNDYLSFYYGPYGRLYNWETSLDACPAGWTLPGMWDYYSLAMFLGGHDSAGVKLKEADTVHWAPPNYPATNESGFTAVPSGWRSENGEFLELGLKALFWATNSDLEHHSSLGMGLRYNEPEFSEISRDINEGLSVRCIKTSDPVAFGNIYSPQFTALGKYNFYVTQTINGCESLPDTLVYTISPVPQLPIAEDVAACEGEANPILIANGENIRWYKDTDSTFYFIDSRDDQEYKAVRIGDQTWMAENLNFYLPESSSYYDDNAGYASVYGRLYNYPDCHQCPNVCPSGWHIPKMTEWQTLIDYLGGDSVAGGSLKEASFDYWVFPNEGATNESNFHALPGGESFGLEYTGMGEVANIWIAETDKECGYVGILSYENQEAKKICKPYYETKASIRCIRDKNIELLTTGNSIMIPKPTQGSHMYYVTQTVFDCESPLDTVILTINPIPSAPVTSDTTVCGINNIPYLTATGENIRWYSDGELTNLLNYGNVFYEEQTQAGKYTYFVTQTITNCEGPADTVYLMVYSVPDVDLGSDTTINDQQDITIGVSENENHSYLWNDGSDEASIIISGQEVGVGDHSYSLIVTDSNSCENSDTVIIHVEHFNAVPYTYESGSIKIYPNPTGEFLNISFEDINDKEILVRVNDISGKEMIHKTYEFFSDKDILELEISYLPDGIYYIGIIGEKIKFSGSFIKK